VFFSWAVSLRALIGVGPVVGPQRDEAPLDGLDGVGALVGDDGQRLARRGVVPALVGVVERGVEPLLDDVRRAEQREPSTHGSGSGAEAVKSTPVPLSSLDRCGYRFQSDRKIHPRGPPRPPMLTDVTHVTVLVEDADEALDWYTGPMLMETRSDESMDEGGRWVTVAPSGADTELILQEPDPAVHGADPAAAMAERVGEGTMTVLGTDDCEATVSEMDDRGVTVHTGPEPVPWGVHAVVADLYGNPYNLVERRD
jgi:predicted enzyme related to lactoylglutathione lyase